MDVDDGSSAADVACLQRKADECDAGGGEKGAPGNGLSVARSWCCRLHTHSSLHSLTIEAGICKLADRDCDNPHGRHARHRLHGRTRTNTDKTEPADSGGVPQAIARSSRTGRRMRRNHTDRGAGAFRPRVVNRDTGRTGGGGVITEVTQTTTGYQIGWPMPASGRHAMVARIHRGEHRDRGAVFAAANPCDLPRATRGGQPSCPALVLSESV